MGEIHSKEGGLLENVEGRSLSSAIVMSPVPQQRSRIRASGRARMC